MNKKKNDTTMIMLFLVVFVLFYFLIMSLIFLNYDSSDFLVLYGSIAGGIIGGLFTYGGVWLGIKEQQDKEYIKELARKNITIDKLINLLGNKVTNPNNKLKNINKEILMSLNRENYLYHLISSDDTQDEKELEILLKIIEEYRLHIEKYENTFLELALDIDIETYNAFFSLVTSLKYRYGPLSLNMNLYRNKQFTDKQIARSLEMDIRGVNSGEEEIDDQEWEVYVLLVKKREKYQREYSSVS